jgi:ABC-type transporter Mla MlaB component
MMYNVYVALAVCSLTMGLPQGSVSLRVIGQRVSDDSKVELAVKKLWSADTAEERAAMEALVHLGSGSVPQLVNVLEDVTNDPTSPHFATGKEKEGSEAFELYYSKPFGPKPGVSAGQLAELEISWRLKRDILEILGRLRAEEAVPLLIRIMERRAIYSAIERMSPEMNTLAQIGTAAVPQLIEAIETASQRSASVGFADPSLTEEEKTSLRSIETFKIQVRAALTLGEIGDARALPILRRLMEESNDLSRMSRTSPYAGFGMYNVRYAIEQIEKASK